MPSAPDGALIIDYVAQAIWHMGRQYRRTAGVRRFRVIAAILSGPASPDIVRYDDLVEALWGDDPTGGPEGWRNYISTVCSVWRPDLAECGVSLGAVHRQGIIVEHGNEEQLARTMARYQTMSARASALWDDKAYRANRGASLIPGNRRPEPEPYPGYFRP